MGDKIPLVVISPTAILPPIAKLQNESPLKLLESVRYLRFLYNPEVRGSRRITYGNVHRLTAAKPLSLAKGAEASPNHPVLEHIRADSFERSYAIRWLTTLVSRADLIEASDETQSCINSLIQEAASLLAICSGAAGSGKVTRTFVFGPTSSLQEVRVNLTDAPLESQDFSSVGAQTWGSACVMAEVIVELPQEFGMLDDQSSMSHRSPTNFRVLELGSGTGLVGLTVAKTLASQNAQGGVVLTDFHPSVLANLRENIQANFPAKPSSAITIESCRLDWSTFSIEDNSDNDLLEARFDLVLGADIIYEEKHAEWIKGCLAKLLRRPDPKNEYLFHLIIPLRRTHTFESSTIEKVFPCAAEVASRRKGDGVLELAIKEVQTLMCEAHNNVYSRMADRGEEVEYAYYKIGWH